MKGKFPGGEIEKGILSRLSLLPITAHIYRVLSVATCWAKDFLCICSVHTILGGRYCFYSVLLIDDGTANSRD